MQIKRYRAAGGVVVQQGLVSGLDPQQVFVLVLDRPSRGEVRLPKGHIDPGESDETAALRETTEEAGYADLAVLADLGQQQVEYDYKDVHYVREERYFLMQLRSAQCMPQSAEDAAQFRVRWVRADEVIAQLTFEAEKRWAERALSAFEQSTH